MPGPRSEVAAGAALTAAAAAALVWANSPWGSSYRSLWLHPLAIGGRSYGGLVTVQDWVNGALMSVFFLVVGLEVSRERRQGDLADGRTALLPVVGAAGGMAGAALVYTVVNHGSAGSAGWGIPMATDIAFTLGALALLGQRVPPGLRLLLLSLAVADDIGSVVMLAVFYAGRIDAAALAGAAAVGVIMVVVRARWPRPVWPLVVAGVVLWALLAAGGVEPALAGVVVGVLVPGRPAGARAPDGDAPGRDPARRMERGLAPVSAFVVLPLFALANAGIVVRASMLSPAGAGRVFVGVVLARVVGKLFGITLACLVVVRLGWGRLPPGVGWRHLAGGAAVAGIGFTVPLLFAERSFPGNPPLVAAAEVGLLAGSLAAFATGVAILSRARTGGGRGQGGGPIPR